MRRIFSEWFVGERAWVIAPLAVWLTAWLAYIVVLMIVQKRVLHPLRGPGHVGWLWKGSFIAAVAWVVVWTVVLSLQQPA